MKFFLIMQTAQIMLKTRETQKMALCEVLDNLRWSHKQNLTANDEKTDQHISANKTSL